MAAAQPRTVRGRIAIYMLAIAFALLAGSRSCGPP
jgi:hypothetical protein